MKKDDCLFCKIANKEIPSNIIYEDTICYAIMDLFPSGYGHVLVIPKEHYETYMETDDKVLKHLIVIAKKIAHAQEEYYHNDGNRLFINCKEAGNQKVFHTHVHIVPKYFDESKIKKEPLDIQAAQLKKLLL